MRLRTSLPVLLALASIVAGCSSEGPPLFIPDGGGSGDSSVSRDTGVRPDGSADSGGSDSGAASCTDPLRPSLELLVQPETDPAGANVVLENVFRVQCRAARSSSPGSTALAEDSIEIHGVDKNGLMVAPDVASRGTGLYEAVFDMTRFANGIVTFHCAGEDQTMPPRCATTEAATLLDLGPTIEIISPTEAQVVSGSMTVQYSVSASPLADNDTGATVGSHVLEVASRTIPTTMNADGTFSASVDFDDPLVFPTPLEGRHQLNIVARNARTMRRVARDFIVDSEGPSIVINTPMNASVVGGGTLVRATISDMAGVDATRVRFTADATYPMLPGAMPGTYEGRFDVNMFPTTVTEVLITVEAFDIAGNRSTASVTAKLDGVAPVSSLNPPHVVVRKIDMMRAVCSVPFDPVGDDSANDGDVVGSVFEVRARIEDLANSSTGTSGTVTTHAGVRESDVKYYITNRTDVPLLVDMNRDGMCDAINPLLEPGPGVSNPAVVVDFAAVRPAGAARYDPMQTYLGTAFDICLPPSSATTPTALCPETSPLSVVVPSVSVGGRTNAIFGKPPTADPRCVGDSFDYQSRLSPGWACSAIRVTDNAGNIGVSEPLRLCLENTSAPVCGAPVGTNAIGRAPNCTDGCNPLRFQDLEGINIIGPF